jgi:hypothetical protein
MKRRAFQSAGGAARIASLVCAIASQACGDGIGRPIKALPLEAAAGAGGSAGAGGAGGPGGAAIGDGGDVPPNLYCAQAASWPADLAAAEDELFRSINLFRSGSGNGCAQFSYGNDPPLTLAPALRCSARLHAVDMAARGFFNQTNPDMVTPSQRMAVAGFPNSAAAEDIGSGPVPRISPDVVGLPDVVVAGEPTSCALGDPNLGYAGVGHYGNFWVIDVANPAP